MPDTHAYSLSEVSHLTGVPKQTLHAWEKRYGLLEPVSAAGGRRLYSSRQISRIRQLRKCVEQSNRIGTLVGLDDDQLRRVLRRSTVDAVRLDKLMPLVEDMKCDELEAELGLHLLSMGVPLFVEELVAPLMQEIGRRWEEASLPVVAEHLVSSAVRSLLLSALRMSSRRGAARRAVFATLDGEHHEIGLIAAAMMASRRDMEPVYLGACVPFGELPHAISSTRAEALVIASTIGEGAELQRRLRHLRDAIVADVSIFVGGEAVRTLGAMPPTGAIIVPSLSDLEAYLGQRRPEPRRGSESGRKN